MSKIHDAKLAIDWCREVRKVAANSRISNPQKWNEANDNLQLAYNIYDKLVKDFLKENGND